MLHFDNSGLSGRHSKGRLPVLPTNIRLGWSWQTVTNALAYYNADLRTCQAEKKDFLTLTPDWHGKPLEVCQEQEDGSLWWEGKLEWSSLFLTFSLIIDGASRKVLQFLCHWNRLTTKTFVWINKNVYYKHFQKVLNNVSFLKWHNFCLK